jgi:hypothetical protein
MTTFADLVNGVYNVTKRSDRSAETTQAVVSAIISEHAKYDYPDDLVMTSPIALTQASPNYWRYSLSLSSLPLSAGGSLNIYPQCRKINFIREITSVTYPTIETWTGYYGELIFNEFAANNIMDNFGREVDTYYTRFGQTININAPREVDNVVIGYYQTPLISLTSQSSYSNDWLADQFPHVYIYLAASDVFRLIGKDAESKLYKDYANEVRMQAVMSKIGAI